MDDVIASLCVVKISCIFHYFLCTVLRVYDINNKHNYVRQEVVNCSVTYVKAGLATGSQDGEKKREESDDSKRGNQRTVKPKTKENLSVRLNL